MPAPPSPQRRVLSTETTRTADRDAGLRRPGRDGLRRADLRATRSPARRGRPRRSTAKATTSIGTSPRSSGSCPPRDRAWSWWRSSTSPTRSTAASPPHRCSSTSRGTRSNASASSRASRSACRRTRCRLPEPQDGACRLAIGGRDLPPGAPRRRRRRRGRGRAGRSADPRARRGVRLPRGARRARSSSASRARSPTATTSPRPRSPAGRRRSWSSDRSMSRRRSWWCRSVREAIGPMAVALFGDPAAAMTVVGVTGTNGKTTSTYLLEAVFRAAGSTPGVIGTTGLRIDGVPGPLAHTTPEAPDLHRSVRPDAHRGRAGGRDGDLVPRARAASRRRPGGRCRALHEPLPGPPGLPRLDGGVLRRQGAGCSPRGTLAEVS